MSKKQQRKNRKPGGQKQLAPPKSTEGSDLENHDCAKKPDPDNKDGNKEAFSQACQMYRHFVTMKYYTVAGFGVATAAVATLYFMQLPATVNAQTAGAWIKICGVIAAVACGALDWRMTDLMYHYQGLIRTFAVELKISQFAGHPRAAEWMWPIRLATVLIYGGAVVAWIFFATMPPVPHKP